MTAVARRLARVGQLALLGALLAVRALPTGPLVEEDGDALAAADPLWSLPGASDPQLRSAAESLGGAAPPSALEALGFERPRRRDTSTPHGGRPTAPGGGRPATPETPAAPVEIKIPTSIAKRRMYAAERWNTRLGRTILSLLMAPAELIRGLTGVRGPGTGGGFGGMGGKAGPYGYDPFGPGQSADSAQGGALLAQSCRSLVDAWIRKCVSPPGGDGFASLLQLGESTAAAEPAAAGALQPPGGAGTAALLQLAQQPAVPATAAAAAAPSIQDLVRDWKKGDGVTKDASGAPLPKQTGADDKSLPPGETCTRMLNDYLYKCAMALM